jgi:hypothetical protein
MRCKALGVNVIIAIPAADDFAAVVRVAVVRGRSPSFFLHNSPKGCCAAGGNYPKALLPSLVIPNGYSFTTRSAWPPILST